MTWNFQLFLTNPFYLQPLAPPFFFYLLCIYIYKAIFVVPINRLILYAFVYVVMLRFLHICNLFSSIFSNFTFTDNLLDFPFSLCTAYSYIIFIAHFWFFLWLRLAVLDFPVLFLLFVHLSRPFKITYHRITYS